MAGSSRVRFVATTAIAVWLSAAGVAGAQGLHQVAQLILRGTGTEPLECLEELDVSEMVGYCGRYHADFTEFQEDFRDVLEGDLAGHLQPLQPWYDDPDVDTLHARAFWVDREYLLVIYADDFPDEGEAYVKVSFYR